MISVRHASIEDLASVAYLFDLYRQFYNQPHDKSGAEQFIRERMEQKESEILVALSEGEIIGFVQLYPIFSSVSMRRAWLLNDLYVGESYRSRGVATLLLDAAKQVARDTKSKWLLLQTGESNATAQALYIKNGWVRETDLFFRFDI
ncbi:GNAT family N-acetyltransferase [Flavihumibacter solisilvae]|uniref:GNAT family N-acetyltransferase n=1 Tax=Flavihumibacter solisilvae TaxID=1349421 RepID=UPI000691554A|nr:GNAT family N-acetyltransferase [Flavihumibacter solisilvae]